MGRKQIHLRCFVFLFQTKLFSQNPENLITTFVNVHGAGMMKLRNRAKQKANFIPYLYHYLYQQHGHDVGNKQPNLESRKLPLDTIVLFFLDNFIGRLVIKLSKKIPIVF